MTKVKIEITCDNASFGDFPNYELGKIMSRITKDLQSFTGTISLEIGDKTKLYDTNGNPVGLLSVIE